MRPQHKRLRQPKKKQSKKQAKATVQQRHSTGGYIVILKMSKVFPTLKWVSVAAAKAKIIAQTHIQTSIHLNAERKWQVFEKLQGEKFRNFAIFAFAAFKYFTAMRSISEETDNAAA